MAAKFEVYNDKVGGKFRFRLKTSNGTRTGSQSRLTAIPARSGTLLRSWPWGGRMAFCEGRSGAPVA